jgi:hypothetical protein
MSPNAGRSRLAASDEAASMPSATTQVAYRFALMLVGSVHMVFATCDSATRMMERIKV